MVHNVEIDDIIAQKIIKDFHLKTKSDLLTVSEEDGRSLGYTEREQKALTKLTILIRLDKRIPYLNSMQT